MFLATTCTALAAFALLANASTVFAGGHVHDEDFVVGRTGSGQLAAEFDTGEIYELPVVTVIPGDGFGLDDPGFMALGADEPTEEFYTLSMSAQIRIELVSKDADLQVLDSALFTSLMTNPSDQWAMPSGNTFDEHPFWFVDDPDFSELGQTFDLSFKLVDASGTYNESPVYATQFIAVPEPHSLALLAIGAVTLIRRKPA